MIGGYFASKANFYRDAVMKKSNRYNPFTQSEIDQLLCLNKRLSKLHIAASRDRQLLAVSGRFIVPTSEHGNGVYHHDR